MKPLRLIPIALALLVAYLFAWPTPIDPERWEAPVYDPSAWSPAAVEGIERVELPDGRGPEDIEVDPSGRIYAGLHDGRVLVWENPGATPEVFADTGGRPLGLHWDARTETLLVADAHAGLLRVRRGDIDVLTRECGGQPLVFTDDVDTAPDGTIWFTDASHRFGQPDWKLDILENRPSGRLCAHDPATGDTREVLTGLYFANGVAVDPAGRFVLVNETARYRVRKVSLERYPPAVNDEILIDNLPGFPDGISTGTDGVYWIAIASPRNPLVDSAAPSPWMRELMTRLPAALQPAPERTTRVIGIDADGAVRHDLFDAAGVHISMVTSVQERGGALYLGSLRDTAWARVSRPR